MRTIDSLPGNILRCEITKKSLRHEHLDGGEVWRKETFQSGTQIVTRNQPEKSHYYVHGFPGDAADGDRKRHRISDELLEWLNGGRIPAWLGYDNLDPGPSFYYRLPEGREITATGPYYDADSPHLLWKEDPQAECQRQALIRSLRERVRPE